MRWLSARSLFACSALCACSAGAAVTIADPDGGHSSSSSSGGSSSSSGSSGGTSCPSTTPAGGAACPNAGQVCEYAGSLGCLTRATCDKSSRKWSLSGPTGCATQDPRCPASHAAVPQQSACTATGLECTYAEGVCACNPNPSPVQQIDAGSYWRCDSPGAACPALRPPLGSSCSPPDQYCAYGACARSGGSAVECKNGVWTGRLRLPRALSPRRAWHARSK